MRIVPSASEPNRMDATFCSFVLHRTYPVFIQTDGPQIGSLRESLGGGGDLELSPKPMNQNLQV